MIFIAEREDLAEIVEMSLSIPKEHGFENLPEVALEKVTGHFLECFKESPIFVYKVDGKIAGFVATQLVELWWSKQPVLTDHIFYVHPDYRSLKVLNALIKAYRDFAKLNGLPIVMNFMSNDRTEVKEKIFERHGFKKSGFIGTYGI